MLLSIFWGELMDSDFFDGLAESMSEKIKVVIGTCRRNMGTNLSKFLFFYHHCCSGLIMEAKD